ncbi:MAG: Grx4 family monothiol glutaredoxin [Polyangiales bacterium]
MALSDGLRRHLDEIVGSHRVVLFMKGTRYQPSCGFSASVVGVLDALLPEYHTVDVLSDPAVRDGIKTYSDWPTIPQLYVDAKFIGGADIVRELHATGELARLLGTDATGPRVPEVTFSPEAAAALTAARADLAGDDASSVLRLEVSSGFEYDLYFGSANAGDVVVETAGGPLHMDAPSAARSDGMKVGWVVTADGGGFKIENPNEPARVQQLSPRALKAMLDAGDALVLVDVRTPEERETAHIEGSRLLDAGFEHELLAMDRGTPLVFQCHHGVRSLRAAEHFTRKGFRKVYNLQGGIDGWSVSVDPTVPRY